MRLKSEVWVQSYLRCLSSDCIPAVIVRRGHESAGAIYIKINRLDGTCILYIPALAGYDDFGTGRYWQGFKDAQPLPENEIDSYLEGQQNFDPDLWIIEVEDKRGRSFLGDAIARRP